MDSELREYQSKINRYSDEQLEEILVTLNKDKFPEKYQLVLSTLSKRRLKEGPSSDSENPLLEKTETDLTVADIQESPAPAPEPDEPPAPEKTPETVSEKRLFTTPIRLKKDEDRSLTPSNEEEPEHLPLTSISDIVSTPSAAHASHTDDKKLQSQAKVKSGAKEFTEQEDTPVSSKKFSILALLPTIALIMCVVYIQLVSLVPALPGGDMVFTTGKKIHALVSGFLPKS